MNITIHTDGGARGNPGPAAVGVVIEMSNDKFPMSNEKPMIIEISKRIGETTNNVAEYSAVLEGLRNVKSQISNIQSKDKETLQIHFFLDSTLVVNQLNGLFKIKDARLRELATQVRILEQETGGVIIYTAVRREQNAHADMLVNRALDE